MRRPRIIHPSRLSDVDLERRVRSDPRFQRIPPDRIPELIRELSNKIRYANHEGLNKITSIHDLGRIFPGGRKLIDGLDETGEPFYSYVLDRYGQADYGELNQSETFLLAFVTRAVKPKVMVDFGYFYGRSARIMAEESPSYSRVIVVDLPSEERQKLPTNSSVDRLYTWLDLYGLGEKLHQSPANHKVRELFYDVRKRGFVQKFDDALEGEKIDLVLFDCAHDYETLKRIVSIALPRMGEDGVLLFDDATKPYSHAGTNKVLVDRAIEQDDLVYLFLPAKMKATEPSAAFMINNPLTFNGRWRALK